MRVEVAIFLASSKAYNLRDTKSPCHEGCPLHTLLLLTYVKSGKSFAIINYIEGTPRWPNKLLRNM